MAIPALAAIGRGLTSVAGAARPAGAFVTGARNPLQWMKENPMLGIPLGVMGGQFAYDVIGEPVYTAVKEGWIDDPLKPMRQASLMQMEMELGQRDRERRWEDINNKMAQASAKLAAVAPHLYNQILAGRTLPQGAVVLGGSPRTDLLEQLAYGMATGQVNQTGGGDDNFLASLGV
jgi:hypothetical protein